jgi:hypothetical protein
MVQIGRALRIGDVELDGVEGLQHDAPLSVR